jgi:hypothetical protein
MVSSELINLWFLGMVLVTLAGLSAPLGMLALSLAAMSGPLMLRPELSWTGSPWMIWLWTVLLALQFLTDLYFVPATVKDRLYLHQARVVNAYLHARLQSLLRPLAAALVLAALPSHLAAQNAAVLGFVCGTALYWGTAWVREQVAISRGSVILFAVEMAKNIIGLMIALIASTIPPLVFGMLICLLAPIALWAGRLRREQLLYPAYGGRIARKDS